MKTINKCENDKVALKHIQYLLDVIQTKDISRRSKILLDGYIYIFEETCHVINCPLAKFLTNPEEKRYKTLLYQHIESICFGSSDIHDSGLIHFKDYYSTEKKIYFSLIVPSANLF